MKTKLSKWGNSLALRLPKQFAESRHLSEGVDLEISAERDGFFVRALPKSLRWLSYCKGFVRRICTASPL